MYKKKFRDTGKEVSLLGLGCMRFPMIDGKPECIDYKEAEKIVDYAYAHGVNYFDTAYMYHSGKSEEFIGQALKKYPRESYYLADKLPAWEAKCPEDVERIFNLQLERCGVDYFDFYLCHNINASNYELYKKYDAYNFLSKMKQEGKIRHLGFSFHDSPELLEQVVTEFAWDFAQIQLNYFDWEGQQRAKEQYEVLEKHGIPCVVMEPVRGGALVNLCEESNAIFKEAAPEASTASWAIRFAASQENVLTVLSGMSTMEQVTDNVATLSDFKPLTQQEYGVIDRALSAFKKNFFVPCTSCRYCSKCPKQLDIPHLFNLFNNYNMIKNKGWFDAEYGKIDQARRADQCIGCKSCEKHCPQGIEIAACLKKVAALANG